MVFRTPIKGDHTENLSIIEHLCDNLEFVAEVGLARDIADGKIWPNDIYNMTYDQASQENENWFSTAYYVFAQRDSQFIVIPYSTGLEEAKKTIFVAYEYGVANALAKDKRLMKIKPKKLAETFVTENITPLAPGSEVTRCGWYFGFTPSSSTVRGVPSVDMAKLTETLNAKETVEEKAFCKDVLFNELFFVYKPTSMHLYQSRFRDMMYKARLAYAYSLAEKNIWETVKIGSVEEIKTNAINMLGTYVDTVCKAVDAEIVERKDGFRDDEDINIFKTGAAKSLCNMIAILDPDHQDEEPNAEKKAFIEGLMVPKPTFNEDMKDYIKNLASESPRLMDVVDNFNWISSEIVPDPWIIDTIIGGASNITEVLDGVPFAGKLLKFLLSQAAKLFGDYLRPMASVAEWVDTAKLMSVDLQMKGCDWNHENEALSEKNPATVVARRRRHTTNRRNRNDTVGQVWT